MMPTTGNDATGTVSTPEVSVLPASSTSASGGDSASNGGSGPASPGAPGQSSDEPDEPAASGGSNPASEPDPAPVDDADVVDTGAADEFSFFVTSYQQLIELAGDDDGFGGDLRYNGAATGLEGADAICQELGRRVGFGHRSWRAFLSTSTVNAIDRIGTGPWYDFAGTLVADDVSGLTSGDRPAGGCCDVGTYDELGIFHDGNTDVNNDGEQDDDHDTMTASNADGTYAGFSCEDWTSTTAQPEGGLGGQGMGTAMFQQGGDDGGGFMGGGGGGIMMGHSWPARSGQGWAQAHGGHACAAGTNFIQNGGGDSATVGGGGGYGGFYCFALAE